MKVKRQKKKIWISKKISIPVLIVVLVLVFVVGYVLRNIPNPAKLTSDEYPESSQLFDRNGKLLYEFYGDRRRTPVQLSEISPNLQKATLAIEDANFYHHQGFDIRGIVRGLYRTIFLKRLQGGSTITQQVVKNGLLTQERTLTRKIKEAILTVAVEIMYSKDQIFEMYFNQTPYGGTMWGAEAAAKGIFNKPVKELSLAEAALVAGLPGSPTRYNPFAHPDAAKNRQELVLTRMEELKMISKEEKDKAVEEKLDYFVNKSGIEAPHFVFYIKEQLSDKYGVKRVNEGGLKVITTLDLDLQNYVQTTVATEIAKLEKMKVSNGAAMVTNAKTGEILAMVGSKDYFANDIDGKYNVTTALRQPGSSIKPLNYALGIESGKITAASVVNDAPTCFQVINQKPYCPTNYGNHYYGIQTIRNSLANSLNIGAVKVLKINGVEDFVASASAMGLKTFKDPANYGLSLTLGGGEVAMSDMAVAFGVFANMGTKQDLVGVLKVTDKNNSVLEEYKYSPGERVLSRETSFIIHNILSDDGARSMVFGSGSMLNIKGHPEVAVKTGTTNDMRDNWTIGFTPDYVAAVWVGNNNNSKMGALVSGTTGAAPIWNKIMSQLLTNEQVKKPVMPNGIVSLPVCNLTGELAPEGGCDSHNEYFKKDFQPKQRISLRMNVLINKDNGKIVREGEDIPNAEWQDHAVTKDITGDMVCLDCQIIELEEKEKDKPIIIH